MSLLALSMVSLVALVGCNESPKADKLAFERKVSTGIVSVLAGESELGFLEVGEGVCEVYAGKDPETGESLYEYYDGATYTNILWDLKSAPEAKYDATYHLGCFGYSLVEQEKSFPLISEVLEQFKLINFTSTFYDAEYVKTDGLEDYFYVEENGMTYYGGVYGQLVKKNKETVGVHIIDAQFIHISAAKSELAEYFQPALCEQIKKTGSFDAATGKINISYQMLNCYYMAF